MIEVINKINYLEIYSNIGKQVHEITNDTYWNTNKENHIFVNRERFNNGDYVESDIDSVFEEINDEIVDNNE